MAGDALADREGLRRSARDTRLRAQELRQQMRTSIDRLSAVQRAQRDSDQQLARAEAVIAGLRTALTTNRRIGIAVGILMVRRELDEEAAFRLLVERSQQRNEKLRVVAERVIGTGDL